MDNQQQNFNNLIIQQYETGLSANKLAQIHNINICTIMRLLRKNNVTIRSIGDNVMASKYNKLPIKFSDFFKDFLIGSLMGDGSLIINKNGRNPFYAHTDKNKETILYYKQVFENEGIKTSSIWVNPLSKCYTFQTECRVEFLPIYQLFYVNSTKKILPNIDLNPTILLYWYIGDGSVKQSGTYTNACQISNKWGNPYILTQFKNLFSINSNYYRDKKTNCGTFYIPHLGFVKMLEYIGKSPLTCYDYKWIIRRCSETIIKES